MLPCFVDCHTHIDKGHIWPRMPNPDGTFMGALNATGDRPRWRAGRADDVARRMDFSLRCAYAHGTKALRTHLDSIAPQDDDLLAGVRGRCASAGRGRIELQAACLVGIEACARQGWFAGLAERVAAAGGVLGAVTYMVPDLDELLDRVFRTAIEHGLDLDFHADETDDVAAVSLQQDRRGRVAPRLRGQDPRRPLLLARAPARRARCCDTLDKVAQAGHRRSSRCRCATCICRTAATTARRRAGAA